MILGTGVVGENGEYDVANLGNGTYWPVCALDTNGDGEIDPDLGDAIGVYGVDIQSMTGEPDTVVVSGGAVVNNIDFAIFDPMAIAGSFAYDGTAVEGCCYQFFVGLFDTTGFDPGALVPDYGTEGSWPNGADWSVSDMDDGLVAGTYYVGAYLDVDGDSAPGTGEPIGLIGGVDNPTPFTVANGSDVIGLQVVLDDSNIGPLPASSWKVHGGTQSTAPALRKIADMIKRARLR